MARLARVVSRAVTAGAQHATPIGYEFRSRDEDAIAWAERHAAELVTNVTEQTRAAIRATVTHGFDHNLAPVDTARLLRAVIGLNEKMVNAVLRRQLADLAAGLTNATARAERYAEKLVRSRAMTIARTETMRAANEGQHQLWQQAIRAGHLTGKEKKVWMTSDPCQICAPMEGETVGINEDFSIGADPPAHPNCRCTMGLVQ